MNLAPVLDLLTQRLGIDPGSLGPSAVRAVIEAQVRAAGLDDAGRYALRLRSDPQAFAALVDAIIVPETWFFRGGDLFPYLAEQARLGWRDRPGTPFRVLSLPCSSGEEPYSFALACREADLPPGAVAIDGVDVSPRLIALAERGVYGELSFRQTPAPLRQTYFRPRGTGWELLPDVRSAVRFLVGNLLDPALLILERPYDLVFCRNVFIYLAPPARAAALRNLARLVRPGGLLCTGAAEPLATDEDRFERTGPTAFFLYRRAERPSAWAIPTMPLLAPPPAPVPLLPAPARHEPPRDLLAEARRLADAGDLDAALSACRAAESRNGPSADLYALLGLIHQARHDLAEAAKAYRKALYLDRHHREALTHLTLLAEQSGEPTRSANLRRRLERLGPHEEDE